MQTRVTIWLDPWPHAPRQGLPDRPGAASPSPTAASSGTGLGLGSPERDPRGVRPTSSSPSIGEELGLFGATAVLIAFLLIVGAGLRIAAAHRARRSRSCWPSGLTTIIGVQAFIIIGGVIRVVPLTGITLPFVSYGGSSLVANYMLLALLIRLSDSTARRLREVPDTPTIAERSAARAARRTRRRQRREPRPRQRPREQADPPARGRPDGLLRAAVRRSSTYCRSAATRVAQRDIPTTPRDRAATSTSRAAPIVTADGVVVAEIGADARRQRPFKYQRDVPDRRPVRRRHRLLHVRLRLDAARAHRRTTCSPGDTAEQQLRRPAEHLQRRATTPATCS